MKWNFYSWNLKSAASITLPHNGIALMRGCFVTVITNRHEGEDTNQIGSKSGERGWMTSTEERGRTCDAFVSPLVAKCSSELAFPAAACRPL
uniref:Uncharacterized protein n=1 Tax=Oryza punctata TaxID=4537 RepID=A0A0E0MM33_ORYPU